MSEPCPCDPFDLDYQEDECEYVCACGHMFDEHEGNGGACQAFTDVLERMERS